jgi:hypothetical protein
MISSFVTGILLPRSTEAMYDHLTPTSLANLSWDNFAASRCLRTCLAKIRFLLTLYSFFVKILMEMGNEKIKNLS